MSLDQINQFIPASGWRAVYFDEDGKPISGPIIGFAAVTGDNGEPLLRGFTTTNGSFDFADETEEFLGYAAPGEDLVRWTEVAREAWEGLSNG